MIDIYIFYIIISKFGYSWKKFYLIILFKINKNFKVNFYYIVLLFRLAIDLKIKGNKKLLFDFKKIKK